MVGSLSESSLKSASNLMREFPFSERCQRADGSIYGTVGKCRKGTPYSGLTPAEQKKLRREKVGNYLKMGQNLSLDTLNTTLSTWRKTLKEASPENKEEVLSMMIALRSLRMKMNYAGRKDREERRGQRQAELAKTPKYDKTPGRRKPIEKASREEVEKRLRKREKKILKEIERLKGEGKPTETAYWMLSNVRESLRYAKQGTLMSPRLEDLYREQGFNARPEMVSRRSDLERRNDILREKDGKPIIAYRGVTNEEFADSFKGLGESGKVHFAGNGVHGNGSYATSKSAGSSDDLASQKTAVNYSYSAGRSNPDAKVIAFAFRSDAKVVQPSSPENFQQWSREIVRKAESKLGYSFSDVGQAAAAMGIHAYRIPNAGGPNEDFWVILNRGAVIVADNPELTYKEP